MNLIPEEAWSRYKLSVAHMRIFGCISYAHTPKEKRKKFDDNGSKCTFIGYITKTRRYRLFDLQKKKTIIIRDIVFDKKGIYHVEYPQHELRKDEVGVGDGFSSKLDKIDEVKKKPKWLDRGNSENYMLDRNFERRVTRSQRNLVIFFLMTQVMKMDEAQRYVEASKKDEWNEAMKT